MSSSFLMRCIYVRTLLLTSTQVTQTSVTCHLKCNLLILIGGLTLFVHIRDMNNHLSRYERQVSNKDIRDPSATSMLVLMIRGLLTNLRFPYAQFPCTELSGMG